MDGNWNSVGGFSTNRSVDQMSPKLESILDLTAQWTHPANVNHQSQSQANHIRYTWVPRVVPRLRRIGSMRSHGVFLSHYFGSGVEGNYVICV